MSEVSDDVVDVLGAYAEAYCCGGDMLSFKFFRRKLAVGCSVRVDYKALYVSNVSEKREQFEAVNEFPGFILATFKLDSEDASGSIRVEFVIKGVVRMIRERGMINLGYLGMLGKEFDYLQRVFNVTLYAKRESLNSLQEDEGVEG